MIRKVQAATDIAMERAISLIKASKTNKRESFFTTEAGHFRTG